MMNSITQTIENGQVLLGSWVNQLHDAEMFANDVSDVLWGSPMASVWCARLSMEMGVDCQS